MRSSRVNIRDPTRRLRKYASKGTGGFYLEAASTSILRLLWIRSTTKECPFSFGREPLSSRNSRNSSTPTYRSLISPDRGLSIGFSFIRTEDGTVWKRKGSIAGQRRWLASQNLLLLAIPCARVFMPYHDRMYFENEIWNSSRIHRFHDSFLERRSYRVK